MDASYITPFIKAIENVFTTMLQTEVTIQSPKLRDPDDEHPDVSGIIGMSGDVMGAVVLSFPLDTAERVVSLFTGMELESTHEDFADAIGELVNMITGNAKADFKGKKASISVPSVVIGKGHQVFQQKDKAVIEIPCDCDCGNFIVLVSLEENPSA